MAIMTAPAQMRARMSRPLNAERVMRRERALTELARVHLVHRGYRNVFAMRCLRQGYPVTTTPAQLARFEVAQEQTAEALEG